MASDHKGKSKEPRKYHRRESVPLLEKRRGFVDETVPVSDAEPNRILSISFWNSKADAEQYDREQFPKTYATLKPLLETEPTIRTFEVHSPTTHRIVAGKVA